VVRSDQRFEILKNHLFAFSTYIYSKSICKIHASTYLSPIKVKINKLMKSPCNGFEYLNDASSEYYITNIWFNWVLWFSDILSDIYGDKKRMGCIKVPITSILWKKTCKVFKVCTIACMPLVELQPQHVYLQSQYFFFPFFCFLQSHYLID
jgi:hypothetical protein